MVVGALGGLLRVGVLLWKGFASFGEYIVKLSVKSIRMKMLTSLMPSIMGNGHGSKQPKTAGTQLPCRQGTTLEW